MKEYLEKQELTLTYNSGEIGMIDRIKNDPICKSIRIFNQEEYPRDLTIKTFTNGIEFKWSDLYSNFDYNKDYLFDVSIQFNGKTYSFPNCEFYYDMSLYMKMYGTYMSLSQVDSSKECRKEIKRLISDINKYRESHENGDFDIPFTFYAIEQDINIEIRKKQEEKRQQRFQILLEKEKEFESRYVSSLSISSGNIDLTRKSKKRIKGARLYNDDTYIEMLLDYIDNDPEKDLIFTIKSPDIKLDKDKKYTVAIKRKRRRHTGSLYIKASSSFTVISDYDNLNNQILYVNINGIKRRKGNIRRIINRVARLTNDTGSKNLHFDSPFELRIYESK